jgi:hypothetical protein
MDEMDEILVRQGGRGIARGRQGEL